MSVAVVSPRAVLADTWSRSAVADVVTVLAATALTAVSAQISIPIPGSPVPVTGQTFAVLLAAAAIGPVRGALAQLLYVALAMVGLPVLAHGASGTSVVFGATGGYLLGFVVASVVVGALARRGWSRSPLAVLGSYAVGTAVIYLFGVTWLAHVAGAPLSWAIGAGLTPFLVGDALKAALAAGVLPLAWRGVARLEGE
ncbi:MAG TPA: biotin transporter BioY [Candidatus Angelobacter sp.]|nr:biotin transporter BioY [Candidatus Angelobacter sp.]